MWVASVGKYSPSSRGHTTNAIERAYDHSVSAIDLPENEEIVKYGDYTMFLVEALPRRDAKECRRFAALTYVFPALNKKKNLDKKGLGMKATHISLCW